MSQSKLEGMAKVVLMLQKPGAKISVRGSDDSYIELDQREIMEATQEAKPVSQNVNVNVSAIASSSVNVSQQIKDIIIQLEQQQISPSKLEYAKKQLQSFEEELKQPKPRWSKGKKILAWALNSSEEIFMKLVILWIQQQGTFS